MEPITKETITGPIEPKAEFEKLDRDAQQMVRDMLRAAPLVDAGHGRFTRAVTIQVVFTATVRCCVECERPYPLTFMLHDELWLAVADHKKDVLCFACAERRLGRHITAADLNDAPGNDELRDILDARSGVPT